MTLDEVEQSLIRVDSGDMWQRASLSSGSEDPGATDAVRVKPGVVTG